jgi:hypothetical protein
MIPPSHPIPHKHHSPAPTLISSDIQTTLNTIDTNYSTGDLLIPEKPKNALRIYFQNINGINKHQWTELQQASSMIKNLNIDIFGCSETNIAWHTSNHQYAQSIIKKCNNQARLATSSSLDTGPTDYQPGGVCNCVTGSWTGRIIETTCDPSGLGRWAGHILIGRKAHNIVIITAY